MPRLLILFAAAGIALVATAGTAAAQVVNPYLPSGSNGYDTSSYQCSNSGAPTSGPTYDYTFGVVRVTGGRPFSLDSCSQALFTQAITTGKPSLYENVAYSKAYAHQVARFCLNITTTAEAYSGSSLQAWQIGCGESYFAYTNRPSGATATAWWLDVETGNSWSTTDKTLNQAAIDGAVDGLKSLGVGVVGVYSYASSWNTITSGSSWAPMSADGIWGTGSSTCSSPFAPRPEWLYQSGSNAFGDLDSTC